jgi:predicted neuraminidase
MVHFEITKDLGKTWEVIGPINKGDEFDAIQPSILTYPNNKLQVLCRTQQDVIAESWSDDNGKTWSKMTATSLPNPNSGTDAVTLKDGRQLLIYNHTTKKGEEPNNRNMLNLAISEDGHNWTPVVTLETKPAKSGYSYPAIIQTSDGLVHITYTYLRQSIKHVVIDPDKLTY